jgi:hypothetical protein
MLAMSIACVLIGCAGSSKPSAQLEPKLGQSQPLPSAPAPEPAPASPREQPVQPDTPPSTDTSEPTEPPASEPGPAIPPPAPVHEDDEELCSHITAVVLSESGNAAGLTGDQIDELIASCSVALAQDRRELGEAEYRKRSSCVRKASSVKAISACKPD